MRLHFTWTAVAAVILSAGSVRAQLMNPSFEASLGAPASWTSFGGVNSAAAFADAGMPTHGNNYFICFNLGTGPATPHGQPGGFGPEASGTAGIEQTFNFPTALDTTLNFDCMFLSNDVNNDFLEVSVEEVGTGVLNMVHLDIGDLGTGLPSVTGLATTAIHNVAVDVGAMFPFALPATPFTLRIHCGNRNNSSNPSRAYVDNFHFTPGTPFAASSVTWSSFSPSFVRVEVTTPNPNSIWIQLLSEDTSCPVGQGPFIGLKPTQTIFNILQFPLGIDPLHQITDATGFYEFFVPSFVLPSGSRFDYLIVVFGPGGFLDEFTQAQRFIWP